MSNQNALKEKFHHFRTLKHGRKTFLYLLLNKTYETSYHLKRKEKKTVVMKRNPIKQLRYLIPV